MHLAIGVSALLSEFVPRFWLRQQLRHCALAKAQHIPDYDDNIVNISNISNIVNIVISLCKEALDDIVNIVTISNIMI